MHAHRLNRLVLLALCLCGSLLPAATPAMAGGIHLEEARPLPWHSLDRLPFYLDIATFPGDSTTARTEFLIRIPGGALAYGDSIDSKGRVRYQLKIKNVAGKTILKEKREVVVPPAAPDRSGFSLGDVLVVKTELTPGWYEMEIKLEDLHTRKIGLAYASKDAHFEGKIKGIFRVPEIPAGVMKISDLEAAWSIDHSDRRTPFTRGGVEVIPNPSRTYGLYQTMARVYYEISGPGPGDRKIQAQARILDLNGKLLLEGELTPLVVSRRTWSQAAFDVSSLLAGAYDLEVSLEDEFGTVVTRRLRFNIAWEAFSWRGDYRQRVDEIHFLVDDEEKEEVFSRLSIGEAEAYLEEYWRGRDPDPTTPRNEERERFHSRVRYANKNYGLTGIEKGMFTDRGRIYIRLGPPDDIRSEVMPTHGLQVDDIARGVAAERGFNAAARLRGRGNIGGDGRSFEVWYYDRLLSSTRAETEDVGPRRPLRRTFVFVDEEGYGYYVLRYSNDQ